MDKRFRGTAHKVAAMFGIAAAASTIAAGVAIASANPTGGAAVSHDAVVRTDVWFKATASTDVSSCVEVKITDDAVLVRDTKDNGTGPILTFTRKEWTGFLARIRSGACDEAQFTAGGVTLSGTAGIVHHYTHMEWLAFLDGVLKGEFDIAPATV